MVATDVGVDVGALVGVGVRVGVGVGVDVGVDGIVDVGVAVGDGLGVDVAVAVGSGVDVGVGEGEAIEPQAGANMSRARKSKTRSLFLLFIVDLLLGSESLGCFIHYSLFRLARSTASRSKHYRSPTKCVSCTAAACPELVEGFDSHSPAVG